MSIQDYSNQKLGIVAHAYNPSTCQSKAGRTLQIRGPPCFHQVFHAGKSCITRPRLNKTKQLVHYSSPLPFLPKKDFKKQKTPFGGYLGVPKHYSKNW